MGNKYKSVLLIDDNETDNFVNRKIIEVNEFADSIVVYSSATEALEHLKKVASAPDIIFLDIMMPIMDGFGFLEEFENLPAHIKDHSRIIMLSTSESFRDLNRANKNRHVRKFLNKPLSDALLAAINV